MGSIFLSGGTGYMGTALTRELLAKGHRVLVLARPGSEKKVAPGAEVVAGDALDSTSFSARLGKVDTFIHLVGVAHPAPWKEEAFRRVDLASLRESVTAAQAASIPYFVYVSVAQPAPVMKAYQQVRRECEGILYDSGMKLTILRPWYVLGPGHWWPVVLKPLYALAEAIPSTRESAIRLGLVTRAEMVRALAWAAENPPETRRILDVPAIAAISAGA